MKLRKWLLAALFATSLTVNAQTLPDITIASNTLVAVLGPAGIGSDLPAWVTNTAYTAGRIVQSPNGRNYMCLIAGTSTNSASLAPSGLGRVTDGTATWVSMLSKPRSFLLVQNTSTNTASKVYVCEHVGYGTNLSSSVTLYSGGHISFSDAGEVPQGKIFVWANVNSTVSTLER